MIGKLKIGSFAMLVAVAFSGCAPSQMFSCIDRHCFVADWTNHHSCTSCCKHGGDQRQRFVVGGEMLVLGDHPPAEAVNE